MADRLVDTLDTFTKKTNDLATQLYTTLTHVLDTKQLTTLLAFDESKYENIVLDSIPSQLLGTIPTKGYSEDLVPGMTEAEKLIDLLRSVE